MNPEYVALLERLNEAKCAEVKAARNANKAATIANIAEGYYAAACWEVRDLEKQLETMRRDLGRVRDPIS